jgi:hypothetical protein
MTRHLRGQAVCANALEVRLDDTDAAVLEAVESQLLNVAVLETALFKALAMLREPRTTGPTGSGMNSHGSMAKWPGSPTPSHAVERWSRC